jgi:hypothetical protein
MVFQQDFEDIWNSEELLVGLIILCRFYVLDAEVSIQSQKLRNTMLIKAFD